MNYYLMTPNSDLKGVPVYLNAMLTESYNPADPMPPMSGYSWTKVRDPNRVYPSSLFLITKDRLYDFDYFSYWDGYIISKELKTIIDTFDQLEYKEVKLEVLNTKGKKISQKEYYFIDVTNRKDCIDYDKSKFELDRTMIEIKELDEDQVIKDKNYKGNIDLFYSIDLIPNCAPDIFKLHEIAIQDLVCSELFKNDLNKKISTIKYIDLSNLRE